RVALRTCAGSRSGAASPSCAQVLLDAAVAAFAVVAAADDVAVFERVLAAAGSGGDAIQVQLAGALALAPTVEETPRPVPHGHVDHQPQRLAGLAVAQVARQQRLVRLEEALDHREQLDAPGRVDQPVVGAERWEGLARLAALFH